MDPFSQAAENYVASQEGGAASSQESTGQNAGQAPELRSAPTAQETSTQEQRTEQAILDLSKHDKFTIAGRELTRDQISKLLDQEKQFQSMNKDYTQKTQSLSAERKAFTEKQKFYQALPYDLLALRQDPTRVSEFIKLYPQEFHAYAENILKEASAQVQAGQNPQTTGYQRPVQDVQTLSRLENLEKFYNEQRVSEKEREINNTITHLSTKYPDAANFKEMVLGRAFEAHNQGTELTEAAWEDIFKQVNSEVGLMIKAKYGNLVKQQTEANKKAKDVGAGGGTAGRAPFKPKKWADIDKAAFAAVDSGQI